jgi:hypothetical protein
MTKPADAPADVRELATALSRPKAMRRGSVSERTIKCSKPSCACASDAKARHGPYFSLTRSVEGKTQSRFLTAEQAQLARQQIADGHKFRDQLDDYWEACEQWADSQLEGAVAADEAAKKGGSQRNFKSRLRKKLKPS